MKKKSFGIQTIGEEIANAISHGLGTGLSIAGMIVLIVTACVKEKGSVYVVSAALYGVGLILLYTFSSLYHSLTNQGAKHVFRIFDHCSIFLLIFSSYIPIFLVVIGGALGWTMFGITAFCTVLGIVLNSVNLERWDRLSQILYVVLGWQAIMIIKPIYQSFDVFELVFLVLGGLSYTIGIIFYKNKSVKFMHFIWHLFVLAGSIFHYFMFLHYYLK